MLAHGVTSKNEKSRRGNGQYEAKTYGIRSGDTWGIVVDGPLNGVPGPTSH